jgi:hypothetical protein
MLEIAMNQRRVGRSSGEIMLTVPGIHRPPNRANVSPLPNPARRSVIESAIDEAIGNGPFILAGPHSIASMLDETRARRISRIF